MYRNFTRKKAHKNDQTAFEETTKVVINIRSGVSKNNGDLYHTIEMVDSENGDYCYTYVVESYENYAFWQPIVEAYSIYDAPIIKGRFHMKKCKNTSKNILVNADSMPKMNNDEIVDRLEYLNAYYNHYFT